MFFLTITAVPGNAAERVFGWVERAYIPAVGATVKAKMDSGALTSSVHAEDVVRFRRGKEKWVRFTVSVVDSTTRQEIKQTLERRLHRRVKLSGAGGEDRRLVVFMDICIGNQLLHEQFSLSNRSDKIYDLLIGRRTMSKLGVLDVNRTFTVEPDCKISAASHKH